MIRSQWHSFMPRKSWISGIVLIVLLLTAAKCVGNSPKPPEILGFKFDPPAQWVLANDTVTIEVTYVTNGHTIEKFWWDADGGEVIGNGKHMITYLAPATMGSYTISVQLQYPGGTVENSTVVKVVLTPTVASNEATPTPTSANPSAPTAVDTPTPILAPTPTNTPSKVILSIEKIEVLMDDSRLDLDNLPRLTGGETVVLEIFAVDSNGKRYASEDLVCEWSVTPIGTHDQDISTDLCKTFYTPSREYAVQTVAVEVQGLEQQFESSYPISIEFDITP